MSLPRFRVAVMGGGIAGLTFAYALSKHSNDIKIDVYETNENYSELGAGLNLMPRVLGILEELGLKGDLKYYIGEDTTDNRFEYYKGNQPEALWFGRSSLGPQAIHRADFLSLLAKHTSSICTTHFSKKLVSYKDTPGGGPLVLHFKDETTAECDILVGADGVKSVVRATMYSLMSQKSSEEGRPRAEVEVLQSFADPKWNGEVIYRGIIPVETLQAARPDHPSLRSPTYFLGKHKFIITYPIVHDGNRFINAAATVATRQHAGTTYDGPWSASVKREEILEQFEGWDPRAQLLPELMKNPSRWVVNTVEDLPTLVSGRVVIIGDAAHAMTPYQASGAGQAVEDALFLATLLTLPQTVLSTIPAALKVYDAARRLAAQEVQKRAADTGRMLMLETIDQSLAESKANDADVQEKLSQLHQDIQAMFSWTLVSALGDLNKTVEKLKIGKS